MTATLASATSSKQAPLSVEPWHAVTTDEVASTLGSGPQGLSVAAASQRLAQIGPNEVEGEPAEPWWRLALRQVSDPLVYILLVAGAVSLAVRAFMDAGVILAVVVIKRGHRLRTGRTRARCCAIAGKTIGASCARHPRRSSKRDRQPRPRARGRRSAGAGARVPADFRLTLAQSLAVYCRCHPDGRHAFLSHVQLPLAGSLAVRHDAVSNRFLFVSMIAVTVAHLAAPYVPVMQRVLGLAPISASQWATILLVGLLVVVGGEFDKLVNRLTSRAWAEARSVAA